MTCSISEEDECKTTTSAADLNIFLATPCDKATHSCLSITVTEEIGEASFAVGCIHNDQIVAYQTLVEGSCEEGDCNLQTLTWSVCNNTDNCNSCTEGLSWSDDDEVDSDLWCYNFDAGDDPFNNPFYDRVTCTNQTHDSEGAPCMRATHSCATATFSDGIGGVVEAGSGCTRTDWLAQVEEGFNEGCAESSACAATNPNGVQDFRSCTTSGCNACGYQPNQQAEDEEEEEAEPQAAGTATGLKTTALSAFVTLAALLHLLT